jgi:hypothetical protein
MAENKVIVNAVESDPLPRKKWETPAIEDASIETTTAKSASFSEFSSSKNGS